MTIEIAPTPTIEHVERDLEEQQCTHKVLDQSENCPARVVKSSQSEPTEDYTDDLKSETDDVAEKLEEATHHLVSLDDEVSSQKNTQSNPDGDPSELRENEDEAPSVKEAQSSPVPQEDSVCTEEEKIVPGEPGDEQVSGVEIVGNELANSMGEPTRHKDDANSTNNKMRTPIEPNDSQMEDIEFGRNEVTSSSADALSTLEGAHREDDSANATSNIYPPAFFCPLTQKLFEDPVVVQDGTTYERSAALAEFAWMLQANNDTAYSNRALKSIIDETVAMTGDSVTASLRRLQRTMSQTLGEVIDNTVPNTNLPNHYRPLPEGHYCPITFNLMHDPVIDPEGNTFERVAVENWIRVNHNSPVTRTSLSLEEIYPNAAMKALLDWEKNKPEDEIHPAVAQWKLEKAPESSDPAVGGNLQESSATATNANITFTGYPRNFTELEMRRAQRHRAIFNFFGIIFAIACLFAFVVLEGGYVMLMLFCVTLMLVFNKRTDEFR